MGEQQTPDSFAKMTVEELYERLKPIARNFMRGERPSHTFGQGTVLVDEMFVRMHRYFPELATSPEARRAVARQAAKVMRRILIDHWKGHQREKRTGDRQRVELTLTDGAGRSTRDPIDVVALDDVVDSLAAGDSLAAQVVDMRFFGGMTMPEIAADLSIPTAEVERAWARAKTWLADRLADRDPR